MPLCPRLLTGVLASSLFLLSPVHAEDASPKVTDWRGGAKLAGLTDAEVERLAKQKILIAGPQRLQVFQVYEGSRVPTFVTSDAVLNAFHVLFEESVVRLERSRSERLAGVLRPIWDGIPEAIKRFEWPEDEKQDAVRRAQITIGVGLRLLGAESPGASKDVLDAIEAEIGRVLAGKERLRPEWLGPHDDGFPFIDYSRFEPRGFYTRDERLRAYFRASAWLQAVPFRTGQDREILTAAVISEAIGDRAGRWEYEHFNRVRTSLLGRYGDLTIPFRAFSDRPWSKEDLRTYRKDCEESWKSANPQKDDPVDALAPRFHGFEPCLRVFPAALLPEGRLFDLWCDPRVQPTREPSGLFVAAALGGDFARAEALAHRTPGEAEELARVIDACRSLPSCGGLYGDYLHCLEALLDEAEPDAPAFVSSDPWKRKSTNAALAGWAQARHTWVLQAREDVMWGGKEDTLAGFVEPDPEFFSRLAELIERSSTLLEKEGAFDESLSRQEFLWLAKDLAESLRGGGSPRAWTEIEGMVMYGRKSGIVDWFSCLRSGEEFAGIPSQQELTPEELPKVLKAVERDIKLLEGSDPLPRLLASCVSDITPPLQLTWRRLERLCRRLEAMSQKQLRGRPWDQEERHFLLNFGPELGAAMLYEGNSYEHPNDDAPRVSSVYADLRDPRAPRYFQAGIARPRALYVLYPWNGEECLCRGVVVPYREFVGPNRLGDAEWRALLDSKDAPPSPSWMEPVVSPEPPGKK
ncbi:MAG: DUF3160 domain-containing protein [Planctomycetota bacterium]